MGQPYIDIENVVYSYDDDETKTKNYALKGVTLTIEKGSFTAVLGRNGSGKSTLAKTINGLLTPDEGRVFVGGVEVTDPDLTEEDLLQLRRRVGMVFQNPDNQLVATVVEEDVAFGPENLGIAPEEIRRRVDEAMETLGISDYAKHAPSKLSGGQKQRVAIAGLLAMRPECMIFDEATAMLDPSGRKEVMDMILKLNREYGITVLHITHNMDEAALADRVAVLDDGKLMLYGSPREVFSKVDAMHKAGLDVPDGTEALNELRKRGCDLPGDLLDPEECARAVYALYDKERNKRS